ncbi:MAG: hypothetical protein ACKO4A_08890, partial [Gammaproteobacteria bacterium]
MCHGIRAETPEITNGSASARVLPRGATHHYEAIRTKMMQNLVHAADGVAASRLPLRRRFAVDAAPREQEGVTNAPPCRRSLS